MTLPTFLLGAVLSSLFGSLYHLVRGGSGKRLLTYLVAGWIGFWVGHLVGQIFEITFFSVGALRLGTGTIFALLALFLANWLAIETTTPKQ
jgi:uncharacterized membrane protein YeaQ/YmgE (transglycosylase-associated protein family)